jgi:NTE family protein
MGLTLIRKSEGTPIKRNPKVALVLAGGAVSGGAFKVGGLKALNDYFGDRRITDLDMYVGLSAGSLLGASLASGITPDEMLKVLDGSSTKLDQLRPIDFYYPNVKEFVGRPAKLAFEILTFMPSIGIEFARGLSGLPDAAGNTARQFLKTPSYTNFEALAMRVIEHVSPTRSMPNPMDQIPSGFFDNVSLERWVRRALEQIRMPNDFRAFNRKTGKQLYVTACDLDTAERTVFGADENAEVTISQAVQASSALPIFYKPARMNGVDYVDGGVRHTANIDIAIEKGADLIVCYNPFRPFTNRVDVEDEERLVPKGGYLSDRGMKLIVNQVFRTLLHSRLKLGIQRYLNDDRFRGDIVLIEPQERDAKFFSMNPIAFWNRNEAVRHGFESVRGTIEQNYDELAEVFGRYGLELRRSSARRRAARARAELGWEAERIRDERDEARRLRLVGT